MPTMFYLIVHRQSDTFAIVPDYELDDCLRIGCIEIDKSVDVDPLINEGFRQARRTNYHFAGYKAAKDFKSVRRLYNDNVKAQLTVNPIKLKYPKK